jgi:type II secretory pathway pseudopilin PulG
MDKCPGRKAKSFTLIETLVMIGVFLLLATTLIPYSIQQLNQNRAENSARQLLGKLFIQQQNAAAQLNNLSYGIELKTNSFVIFDGYSTDNYLTTQEISFEAGVSIKSKNLNGGGSKIFFPKSEIKPTGFGTISLGDSSNTYVISINSEGMMNYYRP